MQQAALGGQDAAASPAMLYSLDAAGRLLSVSQAWLSKLGYSANEAVGRNLTDFLAPDSMDRFAKEILPERLRTGGCDNAPCRMVKKDGGVIDALLSESATQGAEGQPIALGVMADVTALVEASRKLAEANRKLQALTLQDELTGLAERTAFDESLTVEYQRARRDDYSIAILMIDVDGFKVFNDLYGREAANDCLKAIAGAIGRTVRRRGDIAARFGDDVFAIILPTAQESGALLAAARVQQAIEALAIEHDGAAGKIVTACMGIAATWPATSTEVQETLVQDALRALRNAKAQGAGAIVPVSVADASLGGISVAAE